MEAHRLLETSEGEIQSLFRSCSLAVLNCAETLDDSKKLHELHKDFDIRVIRENGGIQLELCNAPGSLLLGYGPEEGLFRDRGGQCQENRDTGNRRKRIIPAAR